MFQIKRKIWVLDGMGVFFPEREFVRMGRTRYINRNESRWHFDEIRKMSIQLCENLNRKYMFDDYDDLSGEKIL